MAIVLTHLVAAYAILAAPWLGRFLYEKTRKGIAAGDLRAKIKLYRVLVIDQIVTTIVVLWLCFSGAIPAMRLGLGAPRSWWLTAGATTMIVILLVQSSLALRKKGPKVREKLKHAEALLPATAAERRWFAAVSVGAGVSEELIFRGFLFYYFTLWFPHINALGNALLTSLIFGMGHLYQGWKGIASTGIAGLIMAGLFLLNGNLLLPMIVHAVGDLRVLLIFGSKSGPESAPPQTVPAEAT
jgi:uncharacterized protein